MLACPVGATLTETEAIFQHPKNPITISTVCRSLAAFPVAGFVPKAVPELMSGRTVGYNALIQFLALSYTDDQYTQFFVFNLEYDSVTADS